MRTTKVLLTAMAITFSGPSVPLYGSFVMSPYLQGVTRSSIYVLVESTVQDTVVVLYGTGAAPAGMAAKSAMIVPTTGSTYVHKVWITGLHPSTLYHYRAVQDADTSLEATFRTAPEPGTPFRFAWFADCRSGAAVHDSIVKRIAEAAPVVSLYGGDLASSPRYTAWKSEFFRTPQLALIARVPFYNAVGNHEGWTANTMAFTQPTDSSYSALGYFSADYGDMHVLVINTEISFSRGSPQFAFAARDLASTAKAWRIVIAHRPAYGAGGHGENAELKAMTTAIFEPNAVDMVIGGHSHFYQHNFVNGIHHMVLGSAGAPLYDPDSATYTIHSAKDYSYGIVDVSPGVFHMMVYNAHGAILDSVVLMKPAGVKTGELETPHTAHPEHAKPLDPATTASSSRPGTASPEMRRSGG
jgi:hypothetical protein